MGGVSLRQEMTAVGGGLFLVGGLLVLAVVLAGTWEQQRPMLLWTSATIATGAGAILIAIARRWPLPLGLLAGLAAVGTTNISLAVVGGGPQGALAFGVLYVFVTVFSFYYFPPAIAAFEVGLTAVAYGIALTIAQSPAPWTTWTVITIANIVIGALIGRGGQRVRELLVSEQAAASQLRELDELRTAFLRAVSHELRTPLTSVLGFAELLEKRRDRLTPEQGQVLVARIGQNARRLDRLLTNLLDIDRISRGVVEAQRERVHLGRLVEGVLPHLPTDTHRIEVNVVGMPIAHVEPSKVERIIENLVANAIRHTPSGTTIRVSAVEWQDGVLLVVEDDGPGIPEAVAAQIFEPFVQGSSASASASPGTGIGLSLVAKFAELHGGEARVTSSDMGGARFEVRLPNVQPPGRDDDVPPVAVQEVGEDVISGA